MLRCVRRGIWLVVVWIIVSSPALAQQAPEEPRLERAVESLTRFEGKLTMRTVTGTLRPVSVSIRNWQIHGRQKIETFLEKGLLVVQLHSGKVKTVIDGEEVARKEGEFWTVPAGSRMSVEVTSESALLQVFALRK